MAWHILHGLLEQVRVHSTFFGKLWIVTMFIFRIVVVARIGDNVYHDEQSQFICNTLTPGCANVCFNRFSPISQLRYWSLMVLMVSAPTILFYLYASHKIYHACAKYPLEEKSGEETEENPIPDPPPHYFPGPKRKRLNPFYYATAPQLCTIRQYGSNNFFSSSRNGLRKRNRNSRLFSSSNSSEKKEFFEKSQATHNHMGAPEKGSWKSHWIPQNEQIEYPVYEDAAGRKIEFIKKVKTLDKIEEIKAAKESEEILKNPQLYRAYWWHVFFRTLLEGGFLVGQYYLYGFFVPERFECNQLPCQQITDCFVSRPMEKTCLLWLMFILSSISCLLSVGEFWSLGWVRFQYAFCCYGNVMTYEEKRIRLAKLGHKSQQHKAQSQHQAASAPTIYKDEMLLIPTKTKFTSNLSLDSMSSETTVESV